MGGVRRYGQCRGSDRLGLGYRRKLRKIINDALERVGERKLTDPTIQELLNTWIENKRGAVSEATTRAYRRARELFLEFLGSRAHLSVRMLKKSHATAFRDHLLAESRTPGTVNTLGKKYLTGAFESARKEGLIDYNPFVAVDALKSTPVASMKPSLSRLAAKILSFYF